MNSPNLPRPNPASVSGVATVPVRAPGWSLPLDRGVLAVPLLAAGVVVALDAAATLRLPLRGVIPWVYAALAVAVLAGLATAGLARGLRQGGGSARALTWLGLLALAASYLALVEFNGRWGLDPADSASTGYDSWSYHAFGDYLLNHPRGQDAGMSMLDEYGAHLMDTRFSGAAALVFLEAFPLFKDPAASHFAFYVAILTVNFFSVLALGRVLLGGWVGPLGAAFLATAGGWLSHAIELANYDNLIFVALSPALVAVLARRDPVPAGRLALAGRAAAGALLLAALLYSYPEGTALFGVTCLPLAVALLAGFRRPGQAPTAALASLLGGLLLALPYLPLFGRFLLNQLRFSQTSMLSTSGQIFPGLFDGRRLPALFALGAESPGVSTGAGGNVLPALLLGLTAAGAWALHRRHGWFAWTALPVAALLFWQGVLKAFDYGTFKVLLCGSWWLYTAIVAGAVTLARRVGAGTRGEATVVAVLAVAVCGQRLQCRRQRPLLPTGLMGPLRELASIRHVTEDRPVLLDVDDAFENPWAVYYLRRLPLVILRQGNHLSMPHIAPFLDRGNAPPPAECRYVLVAGRRPEALWCNAHFSLLRIEGGYLRGVRAPWGVESAPGSPSWVWVGTQPVTFQIATPAGGDWEVSASAFGIGPRAPAPDRIRLEVTDAAGPHEVEWRVGQPARLPVRLAPGTGEVRVRCVEAPRPGPPSDEDQRELMLLMRGFYVRPATVVSAGG